MDDKSESDALVIDEGIDNSQKEKTENGAEVNTSMEVDEGYVKLDEKIESANNSVVIKLIYINI